MSRNCQGCGGILGRDCYNEHDCMIISNQRYSDIEQLQHENEMYNQQIGELMGQIETLKQALTDNKIDIPDLGPKINWELSAQDHEDLPF